MREENQTIDNGFWDIEDLSCFLKVKVKTLYAMAHEIPHYRIGKLIRFKREEIEEWIQSKRVGKQDQIEGQIQKRTLSKVDDDHIDRMIRKTIDQTKLEDYNSDHGKPDHIKGLMGKEV